MLRKGHILVILVIGVIGIFVSLYPDDAYGFGSLTTYHDKDFGFFINHPLRWDEIEISGSGTDYYTVYISDVSSDDRTFDLSESYLHISIYENATLAKGNNLRDWASDLYDNDMKAECNEEGQQCTFSNFKIVKIDEKEAYQTISKFVYDEETSSERMVVSSVRFASGDNIWQIALLTSETQYDGHSEQIHEIINSLKFDSSVMGFYENKLYDFSFNAPTYWLYLENHPLPDGTMLQMVQYPQEFDEGFTVYNSPNISVFFENIPELTIPVLNADSIERYELEQLRINLPNAKINNYEIKNTPYGWESNLEGVVSLNVPFIVRGDFQFHDKTFYFKDSRESYALGYLSPIQYYDNYHSVFEAVSNTMIIQGVVVPEFHEIAVMILGSSIVLAIIFTRKLRSENS